MSNHATRARTQAIRKGSLCYFMAQESLFIEFDGRLKGSVLHADFCHAT